MKCGSSKDTGSGPLGDGVPCSWCDLLSCDGYCDGAVRDMKAINDKNEALLKMDDEVIKCLQSEIANLKTENVRLRKILAHVPGRVAIKAKEEAGFANKITLSEVTAEWEVCSSCDAEEYWTGIEWKPIGMASVDADAERQPVSHRHRRRVRPSDMGG